MKIQYSKEEIFSADIISLFLIVYTPIVWPQAWMMWFAALGQAFLIGRRSILHTTTAKQSA